MFSVISTNVTACHIEKLDYLVYIFIAVSMILTSTSLTQLALKLTKNNGHTPFKDIQGCQFLYQSKAGICDLPVQRM